MELLKQPPTVKLPAEWFTGDVYADVIHRGEEPSRMRGLALWETDDATWLEHVSDDEYDGPRANARTRP
ncbi:hypothetical protein OHS71_35445 [Streptomyces sp. NBC_00377]|uniref:hypothetical protein n=1 Tax=unclassified Streptomyces TaxID=2593676 RepID=UPI002E1CC7F8|nr:MULTISPECIES: hypothetical protein [unclassified Streptomyces]